MSTERLISLDPQSGRVDADANSTGKGLYWLLRHIVLGPAVRKAFRPVEHGVENVPTDGAAILAANHLSFADWIFMPLALNRRITFVAKSDYFTGTGLKGRVQRSFFAGTGQVPVDRRGGRAGEGALRAGAQILARGELFGIFPEGTRSHDGRLYKGRTGVARLALQAQVPVVPVAIAGTDEIAPPGKVLSKIISPTVRFGKPLDFSRYYSMASDRLILRSVTDEIMYAIMEMSGQTYVDEYAPAAKERARAAQLTAIQTWIDDRRARLRPTHPESELDRAMGLDGRPADADPADDPAGDDSAMTEPTVSDLADTELLDTDQVDTDQVDTDRGSDARDR